MQAFPWKMDGGMAHPQVEPRGNAQGLLVSAPDHAVVVFPESADLQRSPEQTAKSRAGVLEAWKPLGERVPTRQSPRRPESHDIEQWEEKRQDVTDELWPYHS
ncbi:MAG: hypothetical protein RL318_1535 [Fibrobacterota bacterium]